MQTTDILKKLQLVKTIKHKPNTLIRAVKSMHPIYTWADLGVDDHRHFYNKISVLKGFEAIHTDIFKFRGDYLLPTDFGLVVVDIRKLKVIG